MKRLRRVAAFAASLLPAIAFAGDGKVSAKYAVSFLGLPIGQSELVAVSSGNTYTINLSARISGVAALFAGGHGSGSAAGRLNGGKAAPSAFSIEIHGKKHESVTMAFAGGAVSSSKRTPQEPVPTDIEPVLPAHLTGGIVDPLSGALFVAPGTGPVIAPATCERTAKVFTGKERLNLIFSFNRSEVVDIGGYKGEALVCNMRFEPVSGYSKERRDIAAMRQRISEVTLVPLTGERTLLPARISIPFALGRGVAVATELNLKP